MCQTPKVQRTKERQTSECRQTTELLLSNEAINRVKRQPTEWEKTLASIHLAKGRQPEYLGNSMQ